MVSRYRDIIESKSSDNSIELNNSNKNASMFKMQKSISDVASEGTNGKLINFFFLNNQFFFFFKTIFHFITKNQMEKVNKKILPVRLRQYLNKILNLVR